MSRVPPFTGKVNLLSDIIFSEFYKISATIIGLMYSDCGHSIGSVGVKDKNNMTIMWA